jgi:hypothetical protein
MTEAQKRAQAKFREKRSKKGFKQRALWFSAEDDAKLVSSSKQRGVTVTEYIREKLFRVSA